MQWRQAIVSKDHIIPSSDRTLPQALPEKLPTFEEDLLLIWAPDLSGGKGKVPWCRQMALPVKPEGTHRKAAMIIEHPETVLGVRAIIMEVPMVVTGGTPHFMRDCEGRDRIVVDETRGSLRPGGNGGEQVSFDRRRAGDPDGKQESSPDCLENIAVCLGPKENSCKVDKGHCVLCGFHTYLMSVKVKISMRYFPG